jgi:hypothetical protein
VAPTALAAYFVDDIAEARTIAARLEGTLALGLPFVVHASEVGLARDQIAIVVGAYPGRGDADDAARAVPAIAARRAEVVALPTSDTAEVPERFVVRIDRGARVPAWSRADVEQIETEADESDALRTMAARRKWVLDRLHAKTPACTLEPGDLFIAASDDLRWYEYAPVSCGKTPAYVEWTTTLLGHAAIVPDGSGYRIHQVVGAQCDSPILESWPYDARGRHRAPAAEDKPRMVLAGC